MKKISIVLGTRPEAIKLSPLIHRLRQSPEEFNLKVCVTGQHRSMLDQVVSLFKFTPDVDLNLMKGGQNLSELTSSLLLGVSQVLIDFRPDILIVHGDTTTTLSTAMAGFYLGIPIAHVEAGLRTYDLGSPFPEEFNRQVVSRIARWHFAPTAESGANLINENIATDSIFVTGNTVVDSLNWTLGQLDSDAQLLQQTVRGLNEVLNFPWSSQKFILVTGHRRENFGNGLEQICGALNDLSAQFPGVHFVYPVHLNPQVREPVSNALGGIANVHLIEPLDYMEFVLLMRYCYLVLTDSGGVQEEAPSLGKPVLLMRSTTERPEGISAGTVEMVGADQKSIITGVSQLLTDELHYEAMARAHNPYGDGTATDQIFNLLRSF